MKKHYIIVVNQFGSFEMPVKLLGKANDGEVRVSYIDPITQTPTERFVQESSLILK